MRKIFITALLSLVFTSSTYAFNLDFLSYSPVFYFTAEDSKLAQAAAIQALNNNTKVVWKNPKTGANGYVVPLNSTFQNGTPCRDLKIFSEAHHVTGESVYHFCKINNDWKIMN